MNVRGPCWVFPEGEGPAGSAPSGVQGPRDHCLAAVSARFTAQPSGGPAAPVCALSTMRI